MNLRSFISIAAAMTIITAARGQSEISVKTVGALFSESPNDYDGITDVWIAYNTDSAYYRQDTIQLFNSINARVGCLSVEWKMDKRMRIDLTRVQHCHEPPMQSLAYKDQNLRIRVSSHQGSVRVALQSRGKDVDVFEVLDLQDVPLWEGGDVAHRMTLRRVIH